MKRGTCALMIGEDGNHTFMLCGVCWCLLSVAAALTLKEWLHVKHFLIFVITQRALARRQRSRAEALDPGPKRSGSTAYLISDVSGGPSALGWRSMQEIRAEPRRWRRASGRWCRFDRTRQCAGLCRDICSRPRDASAVTAGSASHARAWLASARRDLRHIDDSG